MFNEFGDYHQEFQVAEGFPVRIDYYLGGPTRPKTKKPELSRRQKK